MSKFKTLCESILEEAKIDDAIKKASLSSELAQKAKTISTELGTKTSKYAGFIVKNISSDDLLELIKFFEDNTSRLKEKDINKYTAETLKAKQTELGKSKSEVGKEIEKDAPIVWQSPNGLIVIRKIKTWEASKKYGAGTRWCISSDTNKSHWDSYKIQGRIFFFIENGQLPSSNSTYKLACGVNHNGVILETYDAPDLQLSETSTTAYFKKYNIPVDIFKDYITKGIGQTLTELVEQCCYPDHNRSPVEITIGSTGGYIVKGSIEVTPVLVENGKLKVSFTSVSHNFKMRGCDITTLEGFPKTIGNALSLSMLEKLKSLKHCTQSVKYFECYGCNLTSLVGGPTQVEGYYDCSGNQLTDLNGAPERIFNEFNCAHNKLTTLKGSPKEAGSFLCNNNRLTSLEGCPEKVNYNFWCSYNKLTSLEGCPKVLGGDEFRCNNNPVAFTKEDVKKVCRFKRPNASIVVDYFNTEEV